jgi:hypothetical protein
MCERGAPLILVRGQCLDAQRVNIGLHHVAGGLVNQPMPLQWALSVKLSRNNSNVKMSKAFTRAGMPLVQVAFVLYIQQLWL